MSQRDDHGQFAQGNTLASGPHDRILDDEGKRKQLIELVKFGASLTKACALIGILDLHTIRAYREHNAEFDGDLRAAEHQGFLFVLKVFATCLAGNDEKDPRALRVQLDAARHYLACKDPSGWAKTDKHQITGDGGGPIKTESTVKVSTDLERCSREFDEFAKRILGAGDVPSDGDGKPVPEERQR